MQMTHSLQSKREYIHSLTFCRFIAAMLVVKFHFGSNLGLQEYLPAILLSGPVMVTFFFSLSGFVIAHSYRGKDVRLYEFYVKRIARIAPVYWLGLALMVLLAGQPATFLTWTALQAWFPPHALDVNGPGWSISVEVFFYALAPAALALTMKHSSVKTFCVSALFLWAGTQSILANLNGPEFYSGYPSYSHDLIYYFPASHLCSFFLGFASGLLYKSGLIAEINKASCIALLAGTAILFNLIFEYGLISKISDIPFAYSSSFYSLFFSILIFIIARSDKFYGQLFSNRVILSLGEASYAIYILQVPVRHIVDLYLPMPDNALANFSVYVSILIAASVTAYYLFEMPAQRFLRNLLLNKFRSLTSKPLISPHSAVNDPLPVQPQIGRADG